MNFLNKLVIVLTFISCSSKHQENSIMRVKEGSLQPPPPAPGRQMSERSKDIDTLIQVAPYDLRPISTNLKGSEKITIVRKAILSAIGEEQSTFYLESPCYKFSEENGPYEDSLTKAPECRLNDFYLIDLDSDKDLDIVYSSLVDQYVQFDSNFIMILRNDGSKYTRIDIRGYLYSADFSKLVAGEILLKTVSRPCCDYSNYNFFETKLYTNPWRVNQKHVLEIHQSKVKETY